MTRGVNEDLSTRHMGLFQLGLKRFGLRHDPPYFAPWTAQKALCLSGGSKSGLFPKITQPSGDPGQDFVVQITVDTGVGGVMWRQ